MPSISKEREKIKSNNINVHNPKKTIDIKLIKKFAIEQLSYNSILRRILLSEKNNLTIPEFLVKIEMWLKILESEDRK